LNWRIDADPAIKALLNKQLSGVPSVRELTDCTTCHR